MTSIGLMAAVTIFMTLRACYDVVKELFHMSKEERAEEERERVAKAHKELMIDHFKNFDHGVH